MKLLKRFIKWLNYKLNEQPEEEEICETRMLTEEEIKEIEEDIKKGRWEDL